MKLKYLQSFFLFTFLCFLMSCSFHTKFILYNLSEESLKIEYDRQSPFYLTSKDSIFFFKDSEPTEILLPPGQGFVIGEGTASAIQSIDVKYYSLEASKNDSIVFSLPIGMKNLYVINLVLPYHTLNEWEKIEQKGYQFKLLGDDKEYKESKYKRYSVLFIE